MENNNVRKKLSESLQELMKERNIDQKELAEAIGVTQPTVSNWIQQTKYPRIKRIQQLATLMYLNQELQKGKRKYNKIQWLLILTKTI